MDVTNAVSEQNIQPGAGAIGQPPARRGQQFQYSVTTQGRLTDAAEFENITVRTHADGSIVHVKDAARVELGVARLWELRPSQRRADRFRRRIHPPVWYGCL